MIYNKLIQTMIKTGMFDLGQEMIFPQNKLIYPSVSRWLWSLYFVNSEKNCESLLTCKIVSKNNM